MNATFVSRTLLAMGIAGFAVAVASAQETPQSTPPAAPSSELKNLQVLPSTMTRGEVVGLMKGFALGLGVRCTNCHVGEEGAPLSTYDFASDEKPMKLKAREMLKMTIMLNKHHFEVENPAEFKVTCYTCHRGSTEPETTHPLLKS